ncbi:MAG: hypothetical protein J6J27_02395 [Alphaproteobacteria bacterium]|nr:hypothetical protein [Alphaproteobacteria bacterium]
MKKIVATLLFFIFANSFFAPVFSASNVVKEMSLNITDEAFSELKRAAEFFKKQVDSLCQIKKDADICKNGIPNIPNTQNILNKSFSKDKKNETDFQKKFFEVVVGFYDELQKYKTDLETLHSETEIAVKTQQLLVKSTIGKLIEKLNEERRTLNEVNALFDEKAKENDKKAKYDDLTDLKWENVDAVTSDLRKYASKDFEKYREDNKKDNEIDNKIRRHDGKTYAGLDDVEGLLQQKDGESLDDWLNRIEKLKTSLKNEETKTDTNIKVLNTIKSERANDNADKLKKAKIANAFKNCQEELKALSSKSLSKYDPPVTAENCSDVLNELKRDIKGKIETIKKRFDDLKESIYTISLMEIVVFNKADSLLNEVDEKPEKMHKKARWNGEYKRLGYSKDPSPNISYLTEIDNKLNYPTLNGKKLSYSDMDDLIKELGSGVKDDSDIAKNIDSWLGYIEKVIQVADDDIRLVEDYIESEIKICPDYKYTSVSYLRSLRKNSKDISSGNLETPTGKQSFKYALYDAVDECLKQRSINAEVKKCNENSGTQKSGTQDMIEKYAIVNGKANYTSVEDVKNKCFETFKNKCSNKDYKWNLTYDTMKSELKKCEDEAGPKKCNDHIAEVEKVLGVGAKVDTTGWTWLNKAPECYNKSDEKICDDYQKDLKEKLNFTFVDIEDANNTVNVENCKAMVDKVRNKMNAALNSCPELKDKNISEFKNVNEIKDMCAKVKALNVCPALKDRKVSEFKTVAEIEAECKKINIQNAIKICNDVATEKKLKGLLNGEYNDISKVNNDCLDKFKKECSSKDWDSFKLDLLNKNSVNELKKKYDDCSLRKMNVEKCKTYESEQRMEYFKYSGELAEIYGAPTDDLDKCKAFVDEKLCISYLEKKGVEPTDKLKEKKYSVDECLSVANEKELANLKIKLQEEAADFVCKALKVMKYSKSHTAQSGSNIYVEVINTSVREDIKKYGTNFSRIESSVNPSNFFCHVAKYCKLSGGSFPSLIGRCKNNGEWIENPNSQGKHELTNGVKKVVRAEILRVYGDDPSGDICSNISRISNGECN